jgi:hypothetical protein
VEGTDNLYCRYMNRFGRWRDPIEVWLHDETLLRHSFQSGVCCGVKPQTPEAHASPTNLSLYSPCRDADLLGAISILGGFGNIGRAVTILFHHLSKPALVLVGRSSISALVQWQLVGHSQ